MRDNDEKMVPVDYAALRQEYLTSLRRLHDLQELFVGLVELFAPCKPWIAEQSDLESNEFKKAMVLAFSEKINAEISKISLELQEMQPKVETLLAKMRSAVEIQEEVYHGDSPEDR